jgi:hypothetical protein
MVDDSCNFYLDTILHHLPVVFEECKYFVQWKITDKLLTHYKLSLIVILYDLFCECLCHNVHRPIVVFEIAFVLPFSLTQTVAHTILESAGQVCYKLLLNSTQRGWNLIWKPETSHCILSYRVLIIIRGFCTRNCLSTWSQFQKRSLAFVFLLCAILTLKHTKLITFNRSSPFDNIFFIRETRILNFTQ